MRIGIFGGTFNPVHNAHVELARNYVAEMRLDKLLVIPTRVPPHKQTPDLISGEYRLEMCRLAFRDFPHCEVSGMEIHRPEKSYTVDTLEVLHRKFPEDTLCLLMGSDMFLTLTKWRSWARIFQLAILCVGARGPESQAHILTEKARLEALGARCEVVRMKPMLQSSTAIRRMIREGRNISEEVPFAVAAYIKENGLYRTERKEGRLF